MALEIIGKLIKKMPVLTGTSANGSWSKQEIVIEIPGQFPKQVCVSLWGERVNDAAKYIEGDVLKVSFDLQSREYNGRWYTDVRAWRLEKEAAAVSSASEPAQAGNAGSPAAAAPVTPSTPPAAEDPFAATPAQQVDDLPF
ncbi:MAG: DUF3127 domain-containing protein [Prevotellaceae bacterium]|jgi:hypothetical protein|nr:DUF3127 domain-containing protein [Prevotellaceae bacterium]